MKRLKAMSKKVKALFLVGILAVLLIPVLTFAAGTPTFKLEMPEEVERGKEFEVKLYLNNVDAFTALGALLKYDTNNFEFKRIKATVDDIDKNVGVLAGLSSTNTGVNMSAYVNPSGPDASIETDFDGQIATFVFAVKSNAKGGSYDFEFIVDEFSDSNSTLTSQVRNAKTKIVVPATGFTVDSDNIVMFNGDTEKITIKPLPDDGVTTSANTKYTVDGTSVTVDTDGVIHANNNGKSTITINAYGFTKTITVNVINPVEAINFDVDSTIEMQKNSEKQITATIVPHNKNAEPTGATSITWSSNNQGVVEVDQTGKIKAIKGGTAVIRAQITDNGKVIASKECTVKVTVKIESVTIDVESLKLLIDSEKTNEATHQLVVTVNPEDATYDAITYESKDSKVATVSQNGLVTGVSAGKTTIVVKVGNYQPTEIPVEVIIPLKSLELTDKELEMLPSQTKKLGLTINPSNTSEASKIKWESSDEEVATVDQSGNIKTLKPGTTTITVKAEGTEYQVKSVSITIKVLTPVDNVVITPSSEFKMNKGEKKIVGIDTYPKGEDVEKVSVTWESSDETLATVDKNTGLVTALKAGVVTITGTVSNGSKVTAKVTIENPITSIAFENKAIKVELGKTEALKLVINPTDYWYADTKAINWSSDNSLIALVDNKGVVTAKSTGTTTIKAEIAGKTATIEVTVYIPITSVKINEASTANKEGIIEVEKDETYQLTTTITPENTTESKEIKWTSSDDKVISVSDTGLLTIHEAGKVVTITAMTSNSKITASVKVQGKISIKSFVASDTEMKIYKGEANSKVISTTITPSTTTESKVITWKSDDESVAVVSKDGKVTGLKAGTANITGTLANGMSVTVKVTVEIIPLTDFEIEFKEEILKGKLEKINLKAIPENSTELENIVYESSDNEVLTVDEEGNVKGLKAGKATITVKVAGLTKEIEVNVKEIPAEGITAVLPNNKIELGDETKISIIVNPEDCTDELTYTYKSSNTKVATVSEDGKIVAVGIGTAEITVTASNGMTSKVTITVTGAVVNPQTGLESYIGYLVISIVSMLGLGTFVYLKKDWLNK